MIYASLISSSKAAVWSSYSDPYMVIKAIISVVSIDDAMAQVKTRVDSILSDNQ